MLVWGVTTAFFALSSVPKLLAQTSLGDVSIQQTQSCGSRGFDGGMTCTAATLVNCPGDDNLQFVYGVENPTGKSGTIVLFSGGGGGTASDVSSLPYEISHYVAAGYQVIQVAWGPGTSGDGIDWEFTNSNNGTGTNILTAACRPASFLNWVRNGGQYAGPLWTNGGMCAQGSSAGGAGIAYALAWYNAASFLDKALFQSGPTLSDIRQGCQVPNRNYTTICSGTGQAGCIGWPIQEPPGYSLEYVGHYKSEVNAWSGNPTPSCANNSSQTTFDASWYAMSIVNFPTSGQQPIFNYPKDGDSAWLCESTAPGIPPNNSAAQGQIFYQQFTSMAQAGNSLSVNAVTLCPTDEGADKGTVASTGDYGYVDIAADMTDPVKGCKIR
jgi:hypothetical protein